MLKRSVRVVFASLLGAVVACGDAGVAPEPSPAPAGAPNARIIVDWMAEDESAAEITVTPMGGIFRLGKHAISIPPYAICDPAKSSYGVGQWDEPCEPLKAPIQIRAEIRNEAGSSWIDFSPQLRFVPTSNPLRYVWLYLQVDAVRDPSITPDSWRILWLPDDGSPAIDEAASDPTMRTYVWLQGALLFRRIKHFSGYMGSALTDTREMQSVGQEVAY